MKAAQFAALALAGLLATTAVAQSTGAPSATDEENQQSEPNDTHGYENSNPGESSPDPRLEEQDDNARVETSEPIDEQDEREED